MFYFNIVSIIQYSTNIDNQSFRKVRLVKYFSYSVNVVTHPLLEVYLSIIKFNAQYILYNLTQMNSVIFANNIGLPNILITRRVSYNHALNNNYVCDLVGLLQNKSTDLNDILNAASNKLCLS